MRDGVVRRTVKCVARAVYAVDLRVTRVVLRLRGEPGYTLHGDCRCCGACCETPMIQKPAPFFYFRSLRAAFLWWQRAVNGLELLNADRGSRTFVFRCTHFDPETRRCDSYASRPGMCRDYPRALLFASTPELLDDCGYYPLARNAEQIRASLEKLDLPEAERRELAERLFARYDPP